MGSIAPHTIIIADDFTGACDTGVQLAVAGSPCPVVIAPAVAAGPEDAGPGKGERCLVYDIESRHLGREEAARRTFALATAIRSDDPGAVVYKKIDSTLRGNVGAELEALMRVFADRVAVVAPAFPEAGRVTARGRCLVHGTPVDETEFGSDRLSPVRSSRVADLFNGGRTVTECAAADAERLVSLAAPGSIVVVDAADESELEQIANGVAPHLARALLVGSAGLARAIGARLLVGEEEPLRRHSFSAATPAAAVLVVVGSLSERSRAQARSLVATGAVDEEVLDPVDVAAQAARIADALGVGRNVVLRSAEPVSPDAARAAGSAAAEVASLLARVARSAVGARPDIGLVLTGGDTAIATMEALGARTFLVEREVRPGVPAGALTVQTSGSARSIPVVTKAGGFGENDVMIDAVAYLKEGPCSQ